MFKVLALFLVGLAAANVGAQTTTTEEPDVAVDVADNQLVFVFEVDFNAIDVVDFTNQVTAQIVASGVAPGTFTVTLVEGSVIAIVTADDAAAAEGIKASVEGTASGEIVVNVDGENVSAAPGDVGEAPEGKVDEYGNGQPGGKKGKKGGSSGKKGGPGGKKGGPGGKKGGPGGKKGGPGGKKGGPGKKGSGQMTSSSPLNAKGAALPVFLAGAVLVAGVAAVALRRHKLRTGYSPMETAPLREVEVNEATPLVE